MDWTEYERRQRASGALKKFEAVTLIPPPGGAPFKSFRLVSGKYYKPDFCRGNEVTLTNEGDVIELEKEGWTRTTSTEGTKQ